MADDILRRRTRREDTGVRAASHDEETAQQPPYSFRKLPDPRLLSSRQALDLSVPALSLSESSSQQAHLPDGVGSSSQSIDTEDLADGYGPSTRTRASNTQLSASHLSEEGQIGVKRLYSPPTPQSSQSGPGLASTNHTHSVLQASEIDWNNEYDMSVPEVDERFIRSQIPGPIREEGIGADNEPHSKRSRRAWASVIYPTAATRRLEQQLTSNLLRPHGRAGNEIPEQYLDTNIHRLGHLNGLATRFGLDSDELADLQNLLDFFDPRVAGRAIRDHSDDPLCRALAIRRLSRYSPSSHSLDSFFPSTAYMPPSLPLGSKSVIYLSEVLPRSLDQTKRSELLKIFRTKASYVPACINLASGLNYGIQYHVRRPPRSELPQPNLPLGPHGQGWPSHSLPLEVFHIISNHLPRDALQNLRLVNREFERKISNALFHTVVVPFRPEIYGMMVQQGNPQDSMTMDSKGKHKEKPREPERRVHDGMRTFQGWGPHIKRFAMAFEVEEGTLEKPPPKGRFEKHSTFWGRYRWPHPNYNRYEYCEDLERKADEFRCMSAALSNLTGVTELGLSIDSGLGWLNGPDISDRARILREKPRIFGRSQQLLDMLTQQRHDEWDEEIRSVQGSPKQPGLPVQNGFYEATVYWPPSVRSGISRGPVFDPIPDSSIAPESLSRPLMFGGVNIRRRLLTSTDEERAKSDKDLGFKKALLNPNCLSSSQQEWLLEIEWAQRAFISSFCMALSDNSHAFTRVTTLNIACLSSRHLPSLQRKDFWKALQNLNNLTIHVSADWRNIQKTATGTVEAPRVYPSMAAIHFYNLLKSHICPMKNIKVLAIGYVGGGEHQTGIYGRNKNILPAPLVDYSTLMSSNSTVLRVENERSSASHMLKDLLTFNHVEKLTLTNCWFPPLTLKIFCARMRHEKLKTLILKSVSLCFQSGIRSSLQPSETEPQSSSVPQGPPRRGDPSVADFFELRPRSVNDPQSEGWVKAPQRIGSWGQVIDFVTPGANLDFVRYAYQYYDKEHFDTLKRPDPQALESITFESCGYVHLPNFREFQQDILERDPHIVPTYLTKRATDLALVLMDGSCDKFLGEIVTSFPPRETEVLETGFPMVFGWEDRDKAADCLEDGQSLGGSGRFSGKVQRLTFSPFVDDEPARSNLSRHRRR